MKLSSSSLYFVSDERGCGFQAKAVLAHNMVNGFPSFRFVSRRFQNFRHIGCTSTGFLFLITQLKTRRWLWDRAFRRRTQRSHQSDNSDPDSKVPRFNWQPIVVAASWSGDLNGCWQVLSPLSKPFLPPHWLVRNPNRKQLAPRHHYLRPPSLLTIALSGNCRGASKSI